MRSGRTLLLSLGALFAAVALSCTSTHDRSAFSSSSSGTAAQVATSEGVDLARLHPGRHGFHEGGGALVAGSKRHVVRVTPSGSIRFSPRSMQKTHGNGPVSLDGPSVVLSTTTIARDRAFDLEPTSTRASSDGSVAIDRGFVTERIDNGPRGIEQSWRFATAPAGNGDLVVRVALTTSGRVEARAAGVRVVDPASRRAVAYERATWVDAAGSRTTLPIDLEPGAPAHVVMRVPADIVANSAYPAVLDPTVSAEMTYDAPVLAIPSDVDAFSAATAGGKNGGFLVAWTDERFLTVDDFNYFSAQQLLGARVAANGTILDPTGMLIMAPRDFDVDGAKIAFDGTNWLVAWKQYPFNGPCTEIVAARVSDGGVLLDPKNILVSCLGSSTEIDVGYDGGAFLLSWNGSSKTSPGAYARWGQFISTSGVLSSSAPFAIVDAMSAGQHAFACDGVTQCLDVRPTGAGLRARKIAKGGVVGSDVALTATAGDAPSTMSFDGTSFVLGYVSGGATRAMRIDPATSAPIAGDSNGFPIVAKSFGVASASVAGQTLFAWGDASSQLAVMRMPSAGAPDAAPTVLTTAAADASSPALAGSANQYLAVWEAGSQDDGLPMTRISKAPASLDGDGIPLRRAANAEQHPSAGGDANGWLVAWEDFGAGNWSSSIRAMRVDGTGAPIDASSFELWPSGEYPDVASSPANYFVIQSSVNACSTIVGRTIAKTGTPPVLGAPIVISPSCSLAARVMFDGTDYIVVWEGTGGVNIGRVATDGTVLDKKVIGDQPSGFNGGLDVTTNGQELFVAWSYDSGPQVGIRAARLSKAFAILDTPAITIATQNNYAYAPAVAWDGKNYVVVWEDYRNSLYSNADVYLARVSPAGKVLEPDGIAIGSGPINQQWPSIVSMNDGATSLVVWAEARRTDRFRDYGLFGTFVRTGDGAILDPGGREIADGEGNEIFPSLAVGAPGNALLVFHRNDMTSGIGAARVRSRLVSSGVAAGKACTSNDACASRACVDGVCCEIPCGGSCETCAATPGKCTKVTNADDADTCAGDRTCGADGLCKTKQGHTCEKPTDCTTGICTGTVCCDRACDGACETCTATPGTCTARIARSAGAPSCAPYACDGKSAQCPTKCESNDSCPSGSRCEVATGTCIEGAFCVDTRTLASDGATTTDCAPYACASGACRTTCRDVRDCVAPALCDETGECVPPTTAPLAVQSGCATAPPRSGSTTRLAAIASLVALSIVVARRRRRDGSPISSAGP